MIYLLSPWHLPLIVNTCIYWLNRRLPQLGFMTHDSHRRESFLIMDIGLYVWGYFLGYCNCHWTTFRSRLLLWVLSGTQFPPLFCKYSPAVKTTQLEAEPVCSCLMTRGIQAKNLNSVLHPCFKHQFLMAAWHKQTRSYTVHFTTHTLLQQTSLLF